MDAYVTEGDTVAIEYRGNLVEELTAEEARDFARDLIARADYIDDGEEDEGILSERRARQARNQIGWDG